MAQQLQDGVLEKELLSGLDVASTEKASPLQNLHTKTAFVDSAYHVVLKGRELCGAEREVVAGGGGRER